MSEKKFTDMDGEYGIPDYGKRQVRYWSKKDGLSPPIMPGSAAPSADVEPTVDTPVEPDALGPVVIYPAPEETGK